MRDAPISGKTGRADAGAKGKPDQRYRLGLRQLLDLPGERRNLVRQTVRWLWRKMNVWE